LLGDGSTALLEIQHDGRPFLDSGSSSGELPPEEQAQPAGSEMPEKKSKISFIFHNETPKVGPNDPCPCGSGKKFKMCCGR